VCRGGGVGGVEASGRSWRGRMKGSRIGGVASSLKQNQLIFDSLSFWHEINMIYFATGGHTGIISLKIAFETNGIPLRGTSGLLRYATILSLASLIIFVILALSGITRKYSLY